MAFVEGFYMPIPVGDLRDLNMIIGPGLEAFGGPIGSVLAEFWSEWSSHGYRKRVEEFMEECRRRWSADFILNEFAKSPAGMHLLENIIRRVQVEHEQEKRERFANLIITSWVTNDPIEGLFDESILFAEATSKFTPAHLAVLM
jgi:hypothetical protein